MGNDINAATALSIIGLREMIYWAQPELKDVIESAQARRAGNEMANYTADAFPEEANALANRM